MADTINWCKTSNEGLNDALSGNKKAQKAFNDAIKEGLPVEDAFNEALAKVTDEQERADIVAKFLNNTYGESKKKYDELNGSILDANEAELKFKETQAQVGQAVEPLNTAITLLKSQALEAIAPVIEKVANWFEKLLIWFNEHPVAMQILTGVVIALATAFGILAGALAIQGIIVGVTKAIAFLNTTILANPIVLIIALIAGLVAGFIYLWNNCDAFREFWVNLWNTIKTFFVNAWDSIKSFVTETIPQIINNVINWFKQLPGKIWGFLVNIVTKIVTWGSNMKLKATSAVTSLITSVVNWFTQLPGKIWNAIVGAVTKVTTWGSNMKNKAVSAITSLVTGVVSKAKEVPNSVYNAIKDAITKVGTWGTNMVTKAKTAMGKVVTGIKTKLKTAVSAVKSIGSNIVKGLWNGISNKVGWIKSKLAGFKNSVMKALKSFFGIKSPSRVMRDEIGRYIAEGIGVGITDNSDKPIGALDDLSNDMVNGVDALNGATIDRKLATTFNVGSADVTNNNASLLNKLDNIYERLNRLQIVLDSGVLVGETVDAFESALSMKKTHLARGW